MDRGGKGDREREEKRRVRMNRGGKGEKSMGEICSLRPSNLKSMIRA